MSETDSNLIVKHQRPKSYNKPKRREALFAIRSLIVDHGLSHQEIQLRLNLKPATYFRYLDVLFKSEQEAIKGNNYTYQRLLNEHFILCQRYLRRARRMEKLADDTSIDAEVRFKAEIEASEYERAVHDMAFYGPSYVITQGLLPSPTKHDPCLTMSRITLDKNEEEKDPAELARLLIAGVLRQLSIDNNNQEQQQNQNRKQK